ncbi:cyclic nucleotide-binding domain-containing protein [Candidatus Gracilibacteria bacterium]|nr:cyclic nucleotide-binding domain-containing protein [Candidatus Gracilibacteria bacterium]
MNLFQNIDLFSSLPQIEQDNLSDFCQLQSISKGDVLFQEGEEPQALYIIVSGGVGIYKKNDEGVLRQIAYSQKGDLVGEMAFFGKPPNRNASVIALENTDLIVMLHFSMQELLRKYPSIHEEVKQIIESRIEENKNEGKN